LSQDGSGAVGGTYERSSVSRTVREYSSDMVGGFRLCLVSCGRVSFVRSRGAE